MGDLQREIAELENRAETQRLEISVLEDRAEYQQLEISELEVRERAARRARGAGPGRPPLPVQREDDRDDQGSSNTSLAHTNVVPDGRSGRLVAFTTLVESPPPTGTPPNDVIASGTESLPVIETPFSSSIRKLCLISKRVLRRIMAAKESLVKFGTFVPQNDRQADLSPEAPRWKAGRDLEWLRLNMEGTFDGDWTWDKIQKAYPAYQRSDVGFLFYVYDFKFSGEHRVRLAFDGSRQGESTYKETYAPTVRAESVRLFHVFCVEEGLHIGQYDVPQAFLKADIDHDIFVYPPKGQSEFNGHFLKLRRALYGGKQSAYLWFTMINEFLLSLGFVSSPLDNCFYRRSDAVLILYCDDLRIGASPNVLVSLHASLSEKFSVTTAKGDRFLGMDVVYDFDRGYLKLSMQNYITTTMERFKDFDLSQGYPYRELVGCLLWITLNVMGPELLRVKDLARLSNFFGEEEYLLALKVLRRVFVRRSHGIVICRHGAGRELVPSSKRSPLETTLSDEVPVTSSSLDESEDLGVHIPDAANELTKIAFCQAKFFPIKGDKASYPSFSDSYFVDDPEALDIPRVVLPVNIRY